MLYLQMIWKAIEVLNESFSNEVVWQLYVPVAAFDMFCHTSAST